jgi:hypothetical protein
MSLRHFTFGQSHMTNFPLPNGGKLADYWVTVDLPDGEADHRNVFVEMFSSYHCPTAMQFATDYPDGDLKEEYFPGGQLCVVTRTSVTATH